LISSTVGAGSSLTMSARPSKNALVVRECPMWYRLWAAGGRSPAGRAETGRPRRDPGTIHCHHLSSNIPSACGSVSTTIGPGLRPTMLSK
jgi:hypothetical protein